ncbi:MAG TPA: anthranilate phosphoribosyltransferase [Myxococcota bacterium]|nr:anthranilate phosphoribosyltransferase [Myxococcota bacterium]
MIRAALARAVAGERFSRAEARALVHEIVSERASDVEIAGLLTALRARGETLDEIVGAASALRELALPLEPAPDDAIDTCGTGGDGASTFNISTLGALVVAGAGVPVAKHGNRAASSRCGSAELLEALGVRIEAPPERMARAVHEVGFGFLYARACHPAMARVAPVRAALGFRTLFNRLGPLTNPVRVKRQLVGVADAGALESTAAALAELGARNVWVVHSEDGLDEISLAAPTRVVTRAGARVERFEIAVGEIFPRADTRELAGGDVAENARIAERVLANEPGPRRDVVLLNAAAALCAAERAQSLADGAKLAARSLESGRARAVLERLVAFSRADS